MASSFPVPANRRMGSLLILSFVLLSIPLLYIYLMPYRLQHTIRVFRVAQFNFLNYSGNSVENTVDLNHASLAADVEFKRSLVGLVNNHLGLNQSSVKSTNVLGLNPGAESLVKIVSLKQSQAGLPSEQASRPTNHPVECSLDFLKQHAQLHKGYAKMPFTQIGTITAIKPPPGKYDCWFNDSSSTIANKSKCATSSDNFRRILQFGDSNGHRYADGALVNLQKRGWACTKIKEEKPSVPSVPDPKYFVRQPLINLSDIRVSIRSCHGCVSFTAQCYRANRTLIYEYLAMQFFADNEVTTNRSRNVTYYYPDQTTSYQVQSSLTQQAFLFREYLTDKYPDVIIFFISSHFRHKVNDIEPLAAQFFDIIERHLPPTSSVIIASSMKKQYTIGSVNPTFIKMRFERNFTANDMQLWLNARVYDAALPRLVDPVKRWYAFPSLYDVSNTTDQMYTDHVHRTPVWYQSITRYLLQLICLY
jgi:hypothetical protein